MRSSCGYARDTWIHVHNPGKEIAKDNFHYVFERSEAGGLGACPHERKKCGDAPLALRGPLPWRPVLFSDISTNAPSSPERKEKKRGAAVAV
jgi:hypothetical protein